MYRVKNVNGLYCKHRKERKMYMQLDEKVVLIIYYNVLFYLFFQLEEDNFKKQYLTNRIKDGEVMKMKQIQNWCYYHKISFRAKFILGEIFH